MNIQWIKIWRDLTLRPAKALALVLACGLGAFTLITALTARSVLTHEITRSFDSALPAQYVVYLDSADETTLNQVRALPQVESADLRRTIRGRARVGNEWLALTLWVVPEGRLPYVNRFAGPVPSTELADSDTLRVMLEQSSLQLLASMDKALDVRLANGISVRLLPSGTVQDASLAPGWQDKIIYAFTTDKVAARLNIAPAFNEIRLRLRPDTLNTEQAITTVTKAVQQAQASIQRIEASTMQHPHADHMQALLLLLAAFSMVGLIAAVFMSASMVSILMRQHARQIGVMRALGARGVQLILQYIVYIAMPACTGIVLAAPLGIWAANAFVGKAAGQLNLVGLDASFSVPALLAACAIALFVPCAAAGLVAWRLLRQPVAEALKPAGFASAVRSKALISSAKPQGAYAWRGFAYRPWRSVLAIFSLTIGGAALLSVPNVRSSLLKAVDQALETRTDSFELRLLAPAPKSDLLALAQSTSGVLSTEAWGGLLVSFERTRSPLTSSLYSAIAPPPDSTLFRPNVSTGRWLAPNATDEIVLPRSLIAKEPALKLGDTATLRFAERRAEVRIVGQIDDVTEPSIYTSQAVIDRLAGSLGTAGVLRVATVDEKAGSTLNNLEDRLFDKAIVSGLAMSMPAFKAAMVDHFAILLMLLSIAATVSLLVGVVTLFNTAAATVLDRSREIGVLRAMGANAMKVQVMIGGEILILSVLALAFAVLMSFPLTWTINSTLGAHGLHANVPFQPSVTGYLIWPVISICLTVLIVWMTARPELRKSVRDVLNYE